MFSPPPLQRYPHWTKAHGLLLQKSGIEVMAVDDPNWREDGRGKPGSEAQILLQLRLVADAGFVGLPNAGKSSLLACMTRAEPKVASYPFTTLMPNLGVLTAGGGSTWLEEREPSVLVDLPGLIEGAHKGRGLGRMFLRHLARTRMFVHVIDASVDDPAADFWVVREELRLYSPQYCWRPCLVALNKMDLPDAFELQVWVLLLLPDHTPQPPCLEGAQQATSSGIQEPR
jgi:GTPase